MSRFLRLLLLLVLAQSLTLRAQTPIETGGDELVEPTDLEAIVAAAARELLRRQENYRPDRPVGKLPDDELEPWRKKEKARLDEIFGAGEGREWPYEGVYRVRPDGRIPAGYRVGGSALVALAIMAWPGFDEDPAARAAVLRALDFVLEMIETDATLSAGPQRGYDVRGWAHGYGLEFLVEAKHRGLAAPEERAKRIDAGILRLLNCLEVNQARGGGWNYAGGASASFMTGATLLVLYRARELGHEVKQPLIDRALKALEAGRRSDRAHAYAGSARRPVPMPASSARSACAELALHLGGKAEVADLRLALAGFFAGFSELRARKSKQGTHEGPYQIAPYYFYFGHLYAARAIEALPEAERSEQRARLRALLLETRDEDGLWNDRIFPRSKSYSTAMVMMALRAPEIGLPAALEKTETEARPAAEEEGGR